MSQTHGAEQNLGSFAKRLSIRQRLVGAVVLILVLFGLSCLVSIGTFENVQRARELSQHVSEALSETAQLENAITRQESALRAYVLAGAPRFLDDINAMHVQFMRAHDTLVAGNVDSTVQRRRLAEIAILKQRWRDDVVAPVVADVQAGRLESARRRLIDGLGTQVTDPLRDMLNEFRAQVRNDLDRSVAVIGYRQQRARWILLGVLLFGLLVGLFTVGAVVRRVTRPLSRLADTTQRLAGGERDVPIEFRNRNDEIGAVSNALEKFRRIIREQDRQDWIRDHRARLTVLLQQCKTEKELGETLLAEMAPLFGVGYAAIFTPASFDDNERKYSLLAGYGYSGNIHGEFTAGEGLVGQVLVSRKRVMLDDVPKAFLPVRTGLGESRPNVLLLVPAQVGDQVAGVIEMALLRKPTDTQLELLETLMPNVALSLINLARTQRMTELLKQSVAQTEALRESEQRLRDGQAKLQSVNSELRMQSEELNAQSEELRASEEELKTQSDELQATNEELRQRHDTMRKQQMELARLHSEAKRRAEALARASQYKSDFLANMSHELRTPLNSLLILSRSLADNPHGHLDAEEAEAAGIIHESGTNLLALINDILDLSKIEAGKMVANPERTSIEAFVRRIERDFSHVTQRKGLDFEVHLGSGVPAHIVTDVGKLEQVVRNLVSNAIKFTREGRVRVEVVVPAADQAFRTEGLEPGNALAIHVIDDGIGIPRDRLEQIFQAFEQVDASTSRNYGGTGLGLSISRELARLLGGEISVDSELGVGSRFSVFVRRVLDESIAVDDRVTDEARTRRMDASEPVSLPGRVETGAPGDRPPHVLIIDDDVVFAKIVAQAARERGYEATTAADGEHGLDMVRQQLPDAIVLDLGLPGMDGWAVLDRLKANQRTRNIPVHIVSAADDTGQSQQSGAVGFLRKPVAKADLDRLFARAAVLSGREARRVLVVDDDRDAHTAIMHLLRPEEVDIRAVVSGQEALEQLDVENFDCVVLDLSLPDISGFELIERIADREHAPPVVVYSGRELSDEETRQLRAHTDSIVIKGSRAQERLLDEISLFFHRFNATHPVADKAQPVPQAVEQTAPEDAGLEGKTVLLVDDDMRNTFALSRVLRARGLKVLMAGDGFKALDQLAANEHVALVLMDIMMPGMDGYEAIRRIRAQQDFADLPIIAITAKAMSGDRERCIEAGANDYLPKPLDTDVLIRHIAQLLS